MDLFSFSTEENFHSYYAEETPFRLLLESVTEQNESIDTDRYPARIIANQLD